MPNRTDPLNDNGEWITVIVLILVAILITMTGVPN